MKERNHLIVTALLVAAAVISCGSGKSESVGEEDSGKVKIALQTYSYITDYEDNYLTNRLEDEMGVDIQFNLLSANSAEVITQLSLMIASKSDMPDVICTAAMSKESILQYGSRGIFTPLNEMLANPEVTPQFNAIPSADDRDSMLSASMSADGNIYGLPTFEPESWNMTPYRLYINEVWLDKLGLSMPTTTEEYYRVLKAFAEKDPNGNGRADEVPLFGITAGTYGENVIIPLMNSFIYYPAKNGMTSVLTLDDAGSRVIAPFAQDDWKAGLEYLHRLFTEKLLPANVFTDDKTQFMAMLNNEDANLVGALSSGSLSRWNDFDNNANGQEYAMMPPLKGPKGRAYSPFLPYQPVPIWFVTASGSDTERAVRLGDCFYRQDFSTIVRYGEEGADWTRDKSRISNPEYSKAILHDIWGENNNKFWRNINPRYAPLDDYNTWLPANADVSAKSNVLRFVYNPKYNYAAHPDKILPELMYTEEESRDQAEIIVNVSTYVSQSLAQFITGERPLSQWDNYLKELDSMGLETWVENTQKAYERQRR